MPAPLPDTLRRVFGHDDFRPGQREIVESVLDGRPTIAVLPTGGGKSLCYQLPAVLCEGTALVLSPLIALMKDQVDALTAIGVPAARITSADPPEEQEAALRRLAAGELDLVYAAPERLRSGRFLDALVRARLSLVAVDEAHCVSEWGHDFRPDYRGIRPLVERIEPARYAAFTATATPEVRQELGEALGMGEPALFVRGFNRANLHLAVERARGEAERRQRLAALLREHRGEGPALVYTATRKQAEEGAEAMRAAGFRAHHYHAGLEGEERHRLQELFLAGECDAMVATNAFGMGIDKPDIRLVVHLALPASLEAYYQEVGRAGRDGEPARAVLLFTLQDVRTREFLIQREDAEQEAFSPEEELARQHHREGAQRRLQRMTRFATGAACRRLTVLEYFGDPAAEDFRAGCASCDRCDAGPPPELSDEQHLVVRKALSGIARVDGRFGRQRIADVLVGSRSKAVTQSGLDELSTFGLLADHPKTFVLDLLDALEAAGLARTTTGDYPLLAMTAAGVEVMKDERRVAVPWPQAPVPRPQARKPRRQAVTAPDEFAADPATAAGFERLRSWRYGVAQELGKPAFTVFSDATLRAIAASEPHDVDELAQVKGVGPAKLERWGEAVLAALHSA